MNSNHRDIVDDLGRSGFMKAVRYTRYGPPEVLKQCEVARPQPQDHEILIRVHASTVNRSDCGFRAAHPPIVRVFSGIFRPRRQGSGTEFAGDIAAIGRRVTLFKVGDPVFGRLQDGASGAHAEYVCMNQDGAVAHKPSTLPYEAAAAICDGALLAWMYIRLIDFGRQRHVLVNGASGAIGSAAIQLAKARGAEVTAVCKTEAVHIVRSLGADRVIDYKKEDFTKLDRAVDVVFDAVGKSTLARCKPLLRRGGVYMSTELGPLMQNPIWALRTALNGGKIKVYFPIPKYRQQEVLYLKRLVEAGTFRPLIDRAYSLDQIVEATRYVETGEKLGNVVIRIPHHIITEKPVHGG